MSGGFGINFYSNGSSVGSPRERQSAAGLRRCGLAGAAADL